jgi:hypothetical protein
MSCPFFYAREPLSSVPEIRPVPLGRLHRGECRAGNPLLPSETELRAWCNFGYARGECPRFPADAAIDAVRFSIAHADTAAVTVRYCLERDHRPVQHGTLIVTVGRCNPPHADPIVSRLAEAYVSSYLARRKS